MSTYIPTPEELRNLLAILRHAELQRLSKVSGVPFGTLWKVRVGDTQNPGIATVRAFYPHALRIAEETAMKVAA